MHVLAGGSFKFTVTHYDVNSDIVVGVAVFRVSLSSSINYCSSISIEATITDFSLAVI